MSGEGATRLAEVYSKFAGREAGGRAPLYAAISRGVAGDGALLNRLAELPPEKQQPNLLLAAVKYLFGTARDWREFQGWAESHWNAVRTVIMARHTQTNEPARCATLLPLLALLPQPLALIKLARRRDFVCCRTNTLTIMAAMSLAPHMGKAVYRCFTAEPVQRRHCRRRILDVIWRAGLDLNPLDIRADGDVRWLQALVWPGEGQRERLLDQALAVARRDPPRVVKGDLRYDLPRLAAQAPEHATLVVFHTAVLAYLAEASDRNAFGETVKQLGAQWVSNESAALFQASNLTARLSGQFQLSLNGIPQAYTESHGVSIDWIAGSA